MILISTRLIQTPLARIVNFLAVDRTRAKPGEIQHNLDNLLSIAMRDLGDSFELIDRNFLAANERLP